MRFFDPPDILSITSYNSCFLSFGIEHWCYWFLENWSLYKCSWIFAVCTPTYALNECTGVFVHTSWRNPDPRFLFNCKILIVPVNSLGQIKVRIVFLWKDLQRDIVSIIHFPSQHLVHSNQWSQILEKNMDTSISILLQALQGKFFIWFIYVYLVITYLEEVNVFCG